LLWLLHFVVENVVVENICRRGKDILQTECRQMRLKPDQAALASSVWTCFSNSSALATAGRFCMRS
jgi:hypothetical protein